jgi:hypothetical protein
MRLGLGLSIPGTSGLVQAAFSPLDLSPVLWLDASDTSTITEVGGAVSQWDDKSGNGNNVTQGTAAAQPTTGTVTLNGLNVLDFGGNDFMETAVADTLAQPFNVFLVVKADAVSFSRYIFDRTSTGSNRAFLLQSGATNYTFNAGTSLTGGTPDTNAHMLRVLGDGASSFIDVDGTNVASGNAATTSLDLIRLGSAYTGSAFFEGAIAEVIATGTLTAGEIADTEQYLANKWGITL